MGRAAGHPPPVAGADGGAVPGCCGEALPGSGCLPGAGHTPRDGCHTRLHSGYPPPVGGPVPLRDLERVLVLGPVPTPQDRGEKGCTVRDLEKVLVLGPAPTPQDRGAEGAQPTNYSRSPARSGLPGRELDEAALALGVTQGSRGRPVQPSRQAQPAAVRPAHFIQRSRNGVAAGSDVPLRRCVHVSSPPSGPAQPSSP